MAKKYKCRVEYLESTGGQWIDTGVGVKSNTIAKAIFSIASTATGRSYFGARNSSNERFQIVNSFGVGGGYFYNANIYPIANQKYEIEMHANGDVYLDGVKRNATNGTFSPVAFDRSLYIFSTNYYDDSGVPSASTFWKVQILEGDTLVRDMIPVLDLSGRPAMYDQVSGQLFYNQGTGEFTYGRQIIPVEYLESTGTQYIDTGIKGKNNLHYKSKINFTTLSTSGSNGIGGEYLANASAYIGMVRANGHYTYLFNNTAVETTTTIYTNTDYEIDSVMNSGSQVLKVNGETISTGTLAGTFTSTRNIFLYAVCSTNEAADVYGSLKMYYCQIYDNDVLVRDFIPCIDENHVPFMFDLVSNTVYLNAGTGQFKVGPYKADNFNKKLLRKKLALMLANLKKKRRYYCECEYLESTGTQWIDTGIDIGAEIELEFSFYATAFNGSTYCSPLSARRTNQINSISYAFNNGMTYAAFGNNAEVQISPTITLNTKHVIIQNKEGLWQDGNKTNYAQGYNTNFTETGHLYVFARNNIGSSVGNYFIGRIYYCKIWQNGVLVRDMIPVLDWDMTPCMYDRVTEQFFYNMNSSGTGFTVGRQIHQVDYLESTADEYIDTGIKFDCANTKIELKTYEDSLTRIHSICGDDGNIFYYFKGTNNWAVGYNATASNIDSYMVVGDNVFIIDKNNVYLNGVLAKTYTESSTVSSYNALLFNRKTTRVDKGAVTMYYCKIWNNNILVRDFIPMVDELGVGAMFDRVTHTIYDNAGTGAFAYPPVELGYLESSGTQYINTGFNATNKTKWDLEAQFDTYSSSYQLNGLLSSSQRFMIGVNASDYYSMSYVANNTLDILNDNKKHLFEIDAKNKTYSIDGVQLGTYSSDLSITGVPLYLFARNNSGNVDGNIRGKIYASKIYDDDVLARDFIPVFYNGQAGMWDKVNSVFYPNVGTDSFVAGAIVEPEYE